jgi:hypothetical protein
VEVLSYPYVRMEFALARGIDDEMIHVRVRRRLDDEEGDLIVRDCALQSPP